MITGTAAPGDTVSVTRAGSGLIGSAVADGGGSWTLDYTGTALPDGSYAFRGNGDVACRLEPGVGGVRRHRRHVGAGGRVHQPPEPDRRVGQRRRPSCSA